jgi:hypothetical protein
MKRMVTGLFVLVLATVLNADETVTAPVKSVAIFKNGLAAVVREVKPPAEQPFFLNEKIEALHGTLWFSADAGDALTVRLTPRMIDTPVADPFSDMTRAYLGRRVVLRVAPGAAAAASVEMAGTVVEPSALKGRKDWSREYGQPRYGYYSSYYGPRESGQPARSEFLVLRTKDGNLNAIRTSLIQSITAESIAENAPAEVEQWRFEGAQKPFEVMYLTKGMGWAPSYRAELLSDKRLRLSMSACVRNEMGDFADAEVYLVSGFPNIALANQNGLMTAGVTLANFFRGLASDERDEPVMMSQMAMNYARRNEDADGYSVKAAEGDSQDIHYQSVGKRSIREGESVYLPLQNGEADYERIVEWELEDRRNVWAGELRRENRGALPKEGETLWDAIRFKNPFTAPLTTAPVEITSAGQVLGQTSTAWVNPGQEATFRVTKALSVSGAFESTEQDAGRPRVTINGTSYRQPDIQSVLTVRNYRAKEAPVKVTFRFLGRLASSTLEPASKRMLRSIPGEVNELNEAEWAFTVKPGAEQKITLKYAVLVP